MKEKYVWLSKLSVANSTKLKLIKMFNGLENLYDANLNELVYMKLNDKLISKILDKNLKIEAEKDFAYMKKNGIDIIGIDDESYPERLKNINDNPVAFYIKGNRNILNDYGIAIVGSRNALCSSLDLTKELARRISQNTINVISGLARGVDKFAHLGALENKDGGKTIAVLGSGIDVIYPYENKKVYSDIIANGGAIISEYPIKTKPFSYNFPYRNRIISGLSEKVIIIQATYKSGSLITVDYALDQGKDVYVLKDKNINLDCFSGNKLLIEQGAKVIEVKT